MHEKYDIQEDLRYLEWFIAPSSNLAYILGNPLLKLLQKSFRSDKECHITCVKIPTFDERKIRLYIIEPRSLIGKDNVHSMLYMHGGGFLYSAVPYQFRYARDYALSSSCKVFFVDYRLLPKNKYPIPLLDTLSAYQFMIDNKDKYHLNDQKIVVAGDSAGGFLAASLIFKLREYTLPKPCGCLLIYPVLDQRMQTESMKKYDDTPLWDAKANKKMWELLIDNVPCISPSEEKSVNDFPMTYLETSEYDCLHDEGIAFAERLEENGIKVIKNNTLGTYHGYDALFKSQAAKTAVNNRIEALKAMFDN